MDPRIYSILSLLNEEILNKIKMVSVFGQNGQNAIFVTDSDEVFALGQNENGCLGLGNADAVYDNPKPIPALNSLKIKGFAFGGGAPGNYFQIAISKTGIIFVWHDDNRQFHYPKMLQSHLLNKKVTDVACGFKHGLVLCDNGTVFGWTEDTGNRSRNGEERTLAVIEGSIKERIVTAIACGWDTSFAIVNDGSVHAWGINQFGELCYTHMSEHRSPSQISNLAHATISKIACGKNHILALDVAGELYVWGSNTFGQLGINDAVQQNSVPVKNTRLTSVIDIAAAYCSDICAAQTKNTRVYMWGCCKGCVIRSPMLTPYTSLHEVFAYYSTPAVTYKPLKLKSKSKNLTITSLVKSYENAFDDKETSDLTIIVEGKEIYVHKTVLKLRSQYFKNMFQTSWKEAKEETLKIKDFTYEICRAFFKYLYTGETKFSPVLASGVYALAQLHCDDELKNICKNTLRREILLTNVSDLYSNAIRYSLEEIEDLCAHFILKHATNLFGSPEILKWNVEMREKFFQYFADRALQNEV